MILDGDQALKHLAVIMDGNGRWAEEKSLTRLDGHVHGYHAFSNLVSYALNNNIPELTVFALSCENLDRPADEINHLFEIFLKCVDEEFDNLCDKKIEVKVFGDFESFPSTVISSIDKLNNIKLDKTDMRLNICFGYSGKWHIEYAYLHAKNLEDFRSLLQYPFLHPIDFLIRSGKVVRISNFSLWNLAYAELLFLDTYWPDVDNNILDYCLNEFKKRQRRYGLV